MGTTVSSFLILLCDINILFRSSEHRGETTTLTVERDGLYDVSVHKILLEEELKPETIFECLLTIPDTTYSVKEETMYFPNKGKKKVIDIIFFSGVLSSFFFFNLKLKPLLFFFYTTKRIGFFL